MAVVPTTGHFLTCVTTWCKESTHWKRPWCWERLKAEGKRGNRGWEVSITSPAQWTWIWANSRRWWRTGKPSLLQSMGSQRHDLATEQQQNQVVRSRQLFERFSILRITKIIAETICRQVNDVLDIGEVCDLSLPDLGNE